MTVAEQVRQHHRRCAAHLATLRMLAMTADGRPITAETAGAIEYATGAVLGETRAAQDTIVAGEAGGTRPAPAARFLEARMLRLRVAADDVLAAVESGDVPALRRRLWVFTSLTRAMWTVESSFCHSSRGEDRAQPAGR
ncbi:hypothetical protein GCM10023085_11980 [Actinomadura viridis]|uniref:Uncharacterized protein n=1 Tax=Actinomadura viridis TaxID=58110 RepID=A0A931GMS9_9ACTN|nr:hypothetical protein [Actinomadura viridis]MBG6093573.1 hypothetical protein [Actinomadura viridis]